MGLLKKNLNFCILVLVCLLVFAAGAYLAFAESGKVTAAQKKINRAEAQRTSLLSADPAPSPENVAASEQNVAQLRAQLDKIRENLQRGAGINASEDGVRVVASIQQYFAEYQRRFTAITNQVGDEDVPCDVPNGFAFGFDRYFDEATPPQDPAVARTLDKQRQILSYILDQLIEASPHSIKEVKREVLEVKPDSKGKASEAAGFKINPAISARVPGAIDTMAFAVTFTGYTDSLRSFLNELAKFDLPIVVRSVEVQRPQGSATTATRVNAGNANDIFGVFGASAPTSDEAPEEVQKPVISENVSSFTVILEFIEIILPFDSEENPA